MQFVNTAVKEDEVRYHTVAVAAHQLSQWIAAGPRPIESESRSAVCLWKAAVESLLHPPRDIGASTSGGRDGAVFEALSKLRVDWPNLRTGKLRGESAYTSSQVLWERLMCEWPLGSYASMAAEFINFYAEKWHSDPAMQLGFR